MKLIIVSKFILFISLIDFGFKHYGIIKHELINEEVKLTDGVKSMVYGMIQECLESNEDKGFLYSAEKAKYLDETLRHEIETTSSKLDQKITEFMNICLLTYKQNAEELV